jgi:hypothetical protein
MTKKVTYFLLLVFLAGILATCKKYPEGPFFSFRTRMQRITGVWDLELYSSNGVDSTSIIKALPCYCYYSFKKDHVTESELEFVLISPSSSCGGSGTWYFAFGKSSVVITIYPGTGFTPLGTYGTGGKILRLSNKELWIRSGLGSYSTEMHFKKISEN